LNGFWHELFSFGVYKRSQGKVARQATFAALAVIVALGCWSLSGYLTGRGPAWQYGLPLVLFALGMWASFRVVQLPNFADFLISVEGEMNKVSWPSRGELFRASIVVMIVIFVLAAVLFAYDAALTWFFGQLEGLVRRVFG
jgi:preprotein translocase subunit SecE